MLRRARCFQKQISLRNAAHRARRQTFSLKLCSMSTKNAALCCRNYYYYYHYYAIVRYSNFKYFLYQLFCVSAVRSKRTDFGPHDWHSMPVSGAQTWLVVPGLEPGTEYQFSVLAQNKLGTGPFSEVVTVNTTGEQIFFFHSSSQALQK